MLEPKRATSLAAYIETLDDWNEYRIDKDANDMAVHQWTYDLPEKDFEQLYNQVWAHTNNINKLIWGFALTRWQQPLRVAKYTPGLSHDWHVDYTPDDTSKLAFSCALNHQYTGGDLQILEAGRISKPEIGDATWFPAFQGHRVTPVTSGVRYVLLGWITGPRFK
jgi:PKHD-type hydroxylase